MSDYIWSRVEEKIDLLLERAGINWEEKKRAAPEPREKSEAEKAALANAPATPSADQLQALYPNPTEAATIQATPPPATPAVSENAPKTPATTEEAQSRTTTTTTETPPPKTTSAKG